jgi:hypothetical protein
MMVTWRWPKHVALMFKIYVVCLTVAVLYNFNTRGMPYLENILSILYIKVFEGIQYFVSPRLNGQNII